VHTHGGDGLGGDLGFGDLADAPPPRAAIFPLTPLIGLTKGLRRSVTGPSRGCLGFAAGPSKAMCEVGDRTGPPELEGPQIIMSRFIADGSLEQQQPMSTGTRGK